VLFLIAERLHMSVVAVEQMSMREVRGWLAWFAEAQAAREKAMNDDGALDPKSLSKAELRSMFK